MNDPNRKQFRYPGEFEPHGAVMLCWTQNSHATRELNVHQVLTRIIQYLTGEVEVYVNCGAPGALNVCRETLNQAGIDTGQIHFTEFEDELSWARDYGPDLLTNELGQMQMVNFRFNVYADGAESDRVALLAAQMARHQAKVLGYTDIRDSFLVSEGGDREFNGQGTMITIEDTEVAKRNPAYSKAEVEAEFKRVFQLEQVIWLPFATYEDENVWDGVLDVVNGDPIFRSASANGHIDEMCRFVDEWTILLAEITDEEAQCCRAAKINQGRLEAACEALKKAKDINGNSFRIVRIPCPEPIYITTGPGDWIYEQWHADAQYKGLTKTLRDGTPIPVGNLKMHPALSYCNFLIVNQLILAPCYWEEGLPLSIKQKDEQARKVLEAVFPTRKIITLNPIALNLMGGGIHCITKNIPGSPWAHPKAGRVRG